MTYKPGALYFDLGELSNQSYNEILRLELEHYAADLAHVGVDVVQSTHAEWVVKLDDIGYQTSENSDSGMMMVNCKASATFRVVRGGKLLVSDFLKSGESRFDQEVACSKAFRKLAKHTAMIVAGILRKETNDGLQK